MRGLWMLAAARESEKNNGRRGRNYPRSEYGGEENNYRSPGDRYEIEGLDYNRREYNGGVENRFRDRQGRDHYDNGRYAPMRSTMDDAPESRNLPYIPPQWGERRGDEMNRIGFAMDDGMRPHGQEMGREYRAAAEYPMIDEMERRTGGTHFVGHSAGVSVAPINKDTAMSWANKMENDDDSLGPHWTMDRAKQVMTQYNINCDPLEFFLALNMMYSDYSKVFRKHGVGDKMDFYAEMARAFLDDKDAMPEKLSRYYEYIVKH